MTKLSKERIDRRSYAQVIAGILIISVRTTLKKWCFKTIHYAATEKQGKKGDKCPEI